ncbi:MAG: redoxin domain-containing protein [Alphaproteobacteria bacterium]|nr:redoxin domain-containing protein [Alphaproteobacteria bacterium]
MIAWLPVLSIVAWAQEPQGDVLSRVGRCLDLQDVACAQAVVEAEGMARSDRPQWVATAAEVAFSAGDYPQAHDLMQRAIAAGHEDPREHGPLFERTMYATAGWVEKARGRFRVRYRPGADEILVDPVLDVLERTDRYVTPLIGEPPPGSTIVELYPDGRSFVSASSLTLDDVEATGVVAISKWTRLLVTSPRALGRGYDWQATVSHEYIHLVASHASADRAPVWLQEAIAKYLDNRWEHGRDDFHLDPRAEGYLARALADDALVPFDEMHPSLAKIKVLDADGEVDPEASAKRAALAYAQLASLMSYAFELVGDDVLRRALPKVRDGVDPRRALADATGSSSLDVLVGAWRAWLAKQGLEGGEVAAPPTVLDGGDDADRDPVLSKRRDLANFVRLGDLLAARGHTKAALVEYDKASDGELATSPLLASRRAEALDALGRRSEARRLVDESLDLYPTFSASWRLKARLHQASGDPRGAIAALERATALDPYPLDSQEQLAALYRQVGDAAKAAAAEARVTLLRRGGEDDPPPPLHERHGDYEVPRAPEAQRTAARESGRSALLDQPAPDFQVDRVGGGEPLSLAGLAGRVVVLDFWATWCGPCRAVMPGLSSLHERYAADGLTVLGISDETSTTVRKFLVGQEARGVTYAHELALEGGGVRRDYGVRSLPTLVLVDAKGVVRWVHVGAGPLAELEAKVVDLLKVGRRPEAPTDAPGREVIP